MRVVKAMGLAFLVLVVWFVGSTGVAAFAHIGSTYDPNVGAWFLDPTKETELASWSGKADIIGVLVAVALGAVYYFAGRRPRGDLHRGLHAEPGPRPETWFGYDGRPLIRGSRSSLNDDDVRNQRHQD